MPWILKHEYSFNKYIGENNESVLSIESAKEFKTKKEASKVVKMINAPLVVLKKTKDSKKGRQAKKNNI